MRGVFLSLFRPTATSTFLLLVYLFFESNVFISITKFISLFTLFNFVECISYIEKSNKYKNIFRERVVFVVTATVIASLFFVIFISPFHFEIRIIALSVAYHMYSIPEAYAIREGKTNSENRELIATAFSLIVLIIISILIFKNFTFTEYELFYAYSLMLIAPRFSVAIVVFSMNLQIANVKLFFNQLMFCGKDLSRYAVMQGFSSLVAMAPAFLLPALISSRDASLFLLLTRVSNFTSTFLTRWGINYWIEIIKYNIKPSRPHLVTKIILPCMIFMDFIFDISIPMISSLVFVILASCIIYSQYKLVVFLNSRGEFSKQMIPLIFTYLMPIGILAIVGMYQDITIKIVFTMQLTCSYIAFLLTSYSVQKFSEDKKESV